MSQMKPTAFAPRMRDMMSGALIAALVLGTVAAAAPGTPAPAPAVEPVIARAAREIGVRRCLPLLAATAQRVTAGATRQDILVDWNHRDPDAGPLFSLTAMNVGAQSAVVSMGAIPGPAGQAGCSLAVERISATAQPCDTVARNSLQGYTPAKFLENITVYTNQSRQNEVTLLISSENSCLVIRRQVRLS